MTDQVFKRINDYLLFLKKLFRFLIWTGLVLMLIGIVVGLLANGTVYFQLSPGLLFIGGILIFRAIYYIRHLPVSENISNRQYFNDEEVDLMGKIKFFSFLLIASMMACILIAFITQWRYLIPTCIVMVLYVVSEYVLWVIVRFRLQLLKQELKMED